MTLGMIGLLAGILLVAAFFSSSEAAIFSLQHVDREALKEDESIGETVRHLLAAPRRVLAAILMGSEVANIAFSAVGAEIVASLFPALPWLNVLLVAPMLILFGDIVPKTFGIGFSRRVVRSVARPISFWNEMVSPVRFVLTTLADGILTLFGFEPRPPSENLKEAQLRSLIDQGMATGVVQPFEQDLIHRVFEFGDYPVSRLMTPRPDIFSLSLNTPWSELLVRIREARYSRVPIWQGSPENVIGILLVKDLLSHRGDSPPPPPRQVQKLLHPAMFIPPGKAALQLLREFQARKVHLAIVVDEHGSCTGLITLDDLLTELVGEVLDESDAEERVAVEIEPGVWRVQASMDVDDFAEIFSRELAEGDYTTVAGFVFHLLGRAPELGDEVVSDGLRFVVSGVDGRRITVVTVRFRTVAPDVAEPA